ncbi:MAG: carboxylesterase family protein, partial [Pseudomonadota bacterium]
RIADRIAPGGVTADALRAAPVSEIFAAYDVAPGANDWRPPRVIEDGVVLPEGGLLAGMTAISGDLPLIVGTNRDETKLFNLLDDELVGWRLGLLPYARDPAFYDAVSLYGSRAWRARTVDEVANVLTSAGNERLWAYRFDWDEATSSFLADFQLLFGAAHALEIPFIFGDFAFLGSADRWVFTDENEAERVALSAQMMAQWANFARGGAPGDAGGVEWTPWRVGAPLSMVFDAARAGGARMEEIREDPAAIAADIAADPRLASREKACRAMRSARNWIPDIDELVGIDCG